MQLLRIKPANPFPVLLLATFIDLLGIGILQPVLPFLVAQYTHTHIASYVGVITALFAFCEFVAAPALGLLSDRYGRRPVLLLSMAGSALGYLLLGCGKTLWLLFLGRIIDGLTAGNISTIFAYVADITPQEQRAKRYGMIGGAIGLGFIIGPAIGGFAARWGLSAPMYIAAAMCLFNLGWAWFALPETVSLQSAYTRFRWADANPLAAFKGIRSNPGLQSLLLASVFHFIAFAQLQGNITVYFKEELSWNAAQMGIIFLLVGIGDLVTQGYLVGKLHNFFDERKLSVTGISIAGAMYLVFASFMRFHIALEVYVAYLIYAFGKGLFEPSMSSLVSKTANDNEQGKAQGTYQSLQSLTRVIGPVTAAFLYNIHKGLPYVVCAVLTFISAILFLRLRKA
ncbi:MFS transporter, DHA1 family, tetracycline resistance protein [Chitinophaga rupis]|uniref:MFS transporter, DHA1 family, tetracycline resistance protein n=1 Tax=Chitinophaga rupis TaxID=573321 RepID=A0A1H7XHI8_9BACT|nr:MFS transporter [Chitinophaga rupis]SEM33084.1 MFS transporter, DHA1 family, tetracycline resistance protein [Chitinophaga rupis]